MQRDSFNICFKWFNEDMLHPEFASVFELYAFSDSQLHMLFNTHSLPANLNVRTVNRRCGHHKSF